MNRMGTCHLLLLALAIAPFWNQFEPSHNGDKEGKINTFLWTSKFSFFTYICRWKKLWNFCGPNFHPVSKSVAFSNRFERNISDCRKAMIIIYCKLLGTTVIFDSEFVQKVCWLNHFGDFYLWQCRLIIRFNCPKQRKNSFIFSFILFSWQFGFPTDNFCLKNKFYSMLNLKVSSLY